MSAVAEVRPWADAAPGGLLDRVEAAFPAPADAAAGARLRFTANVLHHARAAGSIPRAPVEREMKDFFDGPPAAVLADWAGRQLITFDAARIRYVPAAAVRWS